VDRADLILLAFPLYIDVLVYLPTKALEVIAEHRRAAGDGARLQGLFGLANNGFPEAHQNNLALSILRLFAARSGMTWLGGMALGARRGDPRRTSARGEERRRHPAVPHQPGAGHGRGGTGPRRGPPGGGLTRDGQGADPLHAPPHLASVVHERRGLLLGVGRGQPRPLQSRHAGRSLRRAGPATGAVGVLVSPIRQAD